MITGARVDLFQVARAFDIPLHAQGLALSGRYDAIAGCALVVDGGMYRHEFVSQTVVSALMPVQLSMDAPVFSAVLLPHHFHEPTIMSASSPSTCWSQADSSPMRSPRPSPPWRPFPTRSSSHDPSQLK
jgi:6,7-dimethyl-8-ribityllumazine synthase